MGAFERLEAKGLEVLFNSMWRLKKAWQEFPVGSVFYVDDETDHGAMILYPIAPPGAFIDRMLVLKSNQFLAYFDTTKEVDPSEVPPHSKIDDLIERHLAAQARAEGVVG
jgi:hypothetical protein